MQIPLGAIREVLQSAGGHEKRAVSHLSNEAAAVVFKNLHHKKIGPGSEKSQVGHCVPGFPLFIR